MFIRTLFNLMVHSLFEQITLREGLFKEVLAIISSYIPIHSPIN